MPELLLCLQHCFILIADTSIQSTLALLFVLKSGSQNFNHVLVYMTYITEKSKGIN